MFFKKKKQIQKTTVIQKKTEIEKKEVERKNNHPISFK